MRARGCRKNKYTTHFPDKNSPARGAFATTQRSRLRCTHDINLAAAAAVVAASATVY